MFQDHFTGEGFDRALWAYYNMGSPCYQVPERVGDSELRLYEYDRFNEGNCLLSRRFCGRQASVRAVVTGFEDITNGGACVGFYAGDGAFTGYVLLCAGPDRLEIRIPSGGQRGASFMDAGQPQQVVLAGTDYRPHFPMELELIRDGHAYIARLDGRERLRATAHEIEGDARAVIKALARSGERYTPLWTTFDAAQVCGASATATLAGRVLDESGAGVPHASVHIAGFDDLFALADSEGRFRLENLPRGALVLVAAAEGYQFARAALNCTPGVENCCDITIARETDQTLPRREYNNPSFDRSMNGFQCLNGSWQFQFDPDNVGEAQQWYRPDAAQYDKVIRVPFSWASLMGFGEEYLACGDKTHEANTAMNNYNITGNYGWYRRRFSVPDDFPEGAHIILHVGACTAVTNAWLDGRYLGMRVDEYSDLVFDLGPLAPRSEHTLVIKAEYPHNACAHNMGKQIFWFSSAPGIWQSVWIEPRREAYIEQVHLRPELTFKDGRVQTASVRVEARMKQAEGMNLLLMFYAPDSALTAQISLPVSGGVASGDVSIESPVLWDYGEGNLYTVECALVSGDETMDNVRTYVGLRKVELRWLPGHSPEEAQDPLDQYQYLYLNDRPFYVMGILDQGYNAFGIYTFRSLMDEGEFGPRGSIGYDIDRTLAYGYNLSRLHIKENEPLWFYECDRRGLPVWTEHPSNFFAVPDNPDWQAAYWREMDGMLDRLHNHPSIVIVSSINESWGVEGRHVSTPWKNELRYRFLEAAAERVKALCPHMLVCDNSGFGKTNAGDINDFHYYPSDHFQAREKWVQMLGECYPGSIFNHINAAHGDGHIGEAVQSGKPIFVSEFLHINGIDLQLRMFEKVAGYLRMNVASHEVENSGPLTSDRFERDYGYVDEHMTPLGYDMVNSMDAVVPDINRITHVNAGSAVSVDVYASHFSRTACTRPQLHWTLTGIDAVGQYVEGIASGHQEIKFSPYKVERHTVGFAAPDNMRAAYLFLKITDGGRVLCRNYVQLVFDGAALDVAGRCEMHLADHQSLRYEQYGGCYAEGSASLLWIRGPGSAECALTLPEGCSRGTLAFEAGAREGVGAIKVTDEVKYPTDIDVFVDDRLIGRVSPADDPSDERGLFTGDHFGGKPYNYRNLGQYGYGERFEMPFPEWALTPGRHTVRFECGAGGMTLYGEGTGRYGFNPCLLTQ